MIKFNIFGFGGKDEPAPPAAPAAPVPNATSVPIRKPVNIEGKRVLIVDDDKVFLAATSRKLQLAGFEVRTARDAAEAIAALGEAVADTILMDLTFAPDVGNGGCGSWDGFQIMTWVRGFPSARSARFIVVSNSDSEADRRRAKKLGAVAYFRKPLQPQELIAAINQSN
jgi:CheY-like chemotaxis protein